jgi:glc operon protein GlcG
MCNFMWNNDRPAAFWGDDRITAFDGGVTIRHRDKIIGDRVSGLSEEDERIAYLAFNTIYR